MPVLKNARHERFAQSLAIGKTATESYVIAGYSDNDGNASKMAAKQEIQDRVKEITGKGAEIAEVTVASIFNELEEARALARNLEQPAPMVAATMGKAKVAGYLTDKHEHTGKDGTPLFDPSRYTDDELAQLKRLVEKPSEPAGNRSGNGTTQH